MEEYIEESYDDNFIENPECDELIEEEMIELEEDIYEISDNEEDEEDFKHEDDFYVEEIGGIPKFIEVIDRYTECEEIIKKSKIKSELIKDEFRTIYHYRNLLQKSSLKNKCKLPFDIYNIISKAKNKYYNDKEKPSREELIKILNDFCVNKLITTKGNYLPISYLEAFSENIKLQVVVIRTELSSKKIITKHKFGKKGLEYCLDTIYKKCLKAVINAGENIGTFAATSIAEPSTQLTLNTFHFAGVAEKSKVNKTTERLDQLLRISKDVKPEDVYMTIFLKDKDIKNKDVIKKITINLDNNVFNEFVKEYQIIQDRAIIDGPKGTNMRKDKKIIKHHLKYNKIPKNLSILCLRIKLNIKNLFVKKMSIESIETAIRNKYNNSYIVSSGIGIIRIYLMNLIYGDELDKFKEIITELEELRITGMKGILGVEIKDHEQFLYDKEGKKHVKTVPVIYTTGSNFSELSKYSYLIDIYKSYTNDIYEVYLKLGIGAAKTLLFEEIYSIFESNGISISIDNVSLLVSKMTADGILAPISRNGLKLSKSSTLQKVSFEMPLTYILEASKVGANENVRGTSDNIFFAQPITGATTSFDLCMAL